MSAKKEATAVATTPNRHHKDTQIQLNAKYRAAILAYFEAHTSTMLACEKATGVRRDAWVCRIIPKLEKQNLLRRVRQGLCPISNHRAWYFTATKEGGRNA